YSTLDLAPHLRPGPNTLTALVMDFSPVRCDPPNLGAPCWSITSSGGFLLDCQEIPELATSSDWEVQVDQSFEFHNEGCPHGGFVGYFERIDPTRESGDWMPATELYPAVRLEDHRDAPSPYGLLESMVPKLAESEPHRFESAFLPGGGEGFQPLEIPANSRVEVILDAGALQTGFPTVGTLGGKGSEIRMMYAEGLRLPWSVDDATILGRGIDTANVSTMNDSEQAGWTLDRRGSLDGWFDEVILPGGDFSYEPFHWRTFQFIKLTIETADEPLKLAPLKYRTALFPFEQQHRFQCSETFFQTLDKISWNTFRLCTHETFEDCPYYEQMQYSGDSQITSLIALAATGDTRLTKQALYQFAWSLRADGITECRYPASLPVVIPSWSLHYIFMIADYFDYTGDKETIRELLPCVRSILDWFDRHKDESGLPAKLPHWNTVDWSPRWDRGCPPGWDRGPTCIISSQYLHALRMAAKLEEAVGRKNSYAEEADPIAQKIDALFWNEERGLYEDCPEGPDASQYGNAWAIHSGVASPEKAARAVEAIFENSGLDPASFFGIYFIIRALEDCGQYHRFPKLLDRWQEMIDGGFSTWAEDITYWRSLCHAWSAFPTIEFLRGVLGVKPGKPGFAEILIQPQPLDLKFAYGSVPTPHGNVSVDWKIEDSIFSIDATAPTGIPTRIILPDGSVYKTSSGRFSKTITL
ncbi:MAG: alpha-L-rhamnosidase C-terminal domain-containing protein, partial [Verrucomicrobiota bacterium]|nr:alpha-L-rhamnosidase C-terminal domain-containing protein [Verrucomicrobiota bacterium]